MKDIFIMFYPWSYTGWRYEEDALYQAVIDFNNALPSDDVIKIVFSEKEIPDYMTTEEQIMNFRDSTAKETIIGIMDAVPDETKAIIWYGAAHTTIYPYKNFYFSVPSEGFKWKPLGYFLKQHYGSNFLTYYFVADHDEDLVLTPKRLLNETKLVALKNTPLANIPLLKEALAFLFLRWNYGGWYDGYIIEPEAITGTLYQYNPTNFNLSFLFRLAEDYALKYSPDINYKRFEPDNKVVLGFNNLLNAMKEDSGEDFDYASPKTSYWPFEMHGQFMFSLYYLKLYYGDKLDYTFWKTESSKNLLSALAELREYAFVNNVPAEYIRTNYNSDTLRLYHKYMDLSDIESYNFQGMPGKNIQENYLLKAREIFPEDLWPLYWLGFAAAEKEQWVKGLRLFQELFAQELAFSMESLPLAYQKAALCAEKSGDRRLAEEYNRIADALYNDYNITVDKNKDSLVGYFNGPRSSGD
jgi:hypothetical protein